MRIHIPHPVKPYSTAHLIHNFNFSSTRIKQKNKPHSTTYRGSCILMKSKNIFYLFDRHLAQIKRRNYNQRHLSLILVSPPAYRTSGKDPYHAVSWVIPFEFRRSSILQVSPKAFQGVPWQVGFPERQHHHPKRRQHTLTAALKPQRDPHRVHFYLSAAPIRGQEAKHHP